MRSALARLGLLAAIVALALCSPAPAATVEEIDRALDRAKAYLYEIQRDDGTWDDLPERDRAVDRGNDVRNGQWGGQTALAVYALLAAGENPHDPRLAPAIEFLKKAEIVGVYAAAMRAQVWLYLPRTAETNKLMRRDVAALNKTLHRIGRYRGVYDYTPARNGYSMSRSQYGVLGMWAAAQAGVEVTPNYWRLMEETWTKVQRPDGSWQYWPGDRFPSTPGITAVGVATLFITQDYLHADNGVNCVGNVENPAIERGMQWMVDHFDLVATDERYDRDFPYATIYSVERIAAASGYKHFGDIDWYQKGADWLLKSQQPDGRWEADDFTPAMADTCFGVLFLARGRAPVVVSKLQYTAPEADEPGDWNQRPRDVANLTRFLAQAAERELNWQIVRADGGVDDFFDSAVLYVSGKNAWVPTDEQKAKLKAYVEGGGMILANADCGGAGFAKSVQALASELFPQYAFRELPASHPVYTDQQFTRDRWRANHSVLGLSNGARELILLVPTSDLGKTWQLNAVGGREEAWQLGANLLQYAVDKRNLRLRGQTHVVNRDDAVTADRTITVARLRYDGNWDPEPGGWRRLANLLHNRHGVELDVSSVTPTRGVLTAKRPRFAHLTGTTSFAFDADSQAELRRFTDTGGTLIVDAAGGSSEFATSAEQLLQDLYPDAKLQRLSPDHPLYADATPTTRANTTLSATTTTTTAATAAATTSSTTQPFLRVAYRPYAQSRIGATDDTPRLQAIERDGRLVAFYSREDLSAGLVGQPVDGIIGYEPASATDLMSRILLFEDW